MNRKKFLIAALSLPFAIKQVIKASSRRELRQSDFIVTGKSAILRPGEYNISTFINYYLPPCVERFDAAGTILYLTGDCTGFWISKHPNKLYLSNFTVIGKE